MARRRGVHPPRAHAAAAVAIALVALLIAVPSEACSYMGNATLEHSNVQFTASASVVHGAVIAHHVHPQSFGTKAVVLADTSVLKGDVATSSTDKPCSTVVALGDWQDGLNCGVNAPSISSSGTFYLCSLNTVEVTADMLSNATASAPETINSFSSDFSNPLWNELLTQDEMASAAEGGWCWGSILTNGYPALGYLPLGIPYADAPPPSTPNCPDDGTCRSVIECAEAAPAGTCFPYENGCNTTPAPSPCRCGSSTTGECVQYLDDGSCPDAACPCGYVNGACIAVDAATGICPRDSDCSCGVGANGACIEPVTASGQCPGIPDDCPCGLEPSGGCTEVAADGACPDGTPVACDCVRNGGCVPAGADGNCQPAPSPIPEDDCECGADTATGECLQPTTASGECPPKPTPSPTVCPCVVAGVCVPANSAGACPGQGCQCVKANGECVDRVSDPTTGVVNACPEGAVPAPSPSPSDDRGGCACGLTASGACSALSADGASCADGTVPSCEQCGWGADGRCTEVDSDTGACAPECPCGRDAAGACIPPSADGTCGEGTSAPVPAPTPEGGGGGDPDTPAPAPAPLCACGRDAAGVCVPPDANGTCPEEEDETVTSGSPGRRAAWAAATLAAALAAALA